MMNPGMAGLVAAYIFIVLLALAVIFYTGWRRPVKAAVVAAVAGFCLVSWLSLPELLGWPVERDPPQRFRLHAAHVQQPDKLSKSQGAIYLWLTDSADLGRRPVPRAYRFPYTTATHEIVINAISRSNKGMAQMGEFRGAGGSSFSMLHDPASAGTPSLGVTFFDIPDPLFPDK